MSPLARRGPFGLALATDAFGVRTSTAATTAIASRQGAATRARALLEASFNSARGLTLATRAGARYDGGDADTGAGAETGASLGFRGRGLDAALDARAAFGSGGHREWGAALRFAFDPGTPGQGLRLSVSPARGQPQSGVRNLLDGGYPGARGPAHDLSGWRLDAETGYALPSLGNGSLDTYARLSAHPGRRLWSAGTRYDMNQTLRLTLESASTTSRPSRATSNSASNSSSDPTGRGPRLAVPTSVTAIGHGAARCGHWQGQPRFRHFCT